MTSVLDIPEVVTEVMDEALEWFMDNPGEESLPAYILSNMNEVGLDPDRTTLRLLMERDRTNS